MVMGKATHIKYEARGDELGQLRTWDLHRFMRMDMIYPL